MGKVVVGTVAGVLSWLFAPTLVVAQEIGPDPDPMTDPASPAPSAPPATGLDSPGGMYGDAHRSAEDAGAYSGGMRGAPGSGYGISLSLGGGVSNFVNGGATSMAGLGGSWNVRVGVGTRTLAGIEVGYAGSAHDIAAPGLDGDSYAVRNGAEAAVRLNAPLVMERWTFSPFALIGAGWDRYDLMKADFNTSMVRDSDNVFVVPLGAGVASSFAGFLVDARLTYRAAFDDSFLGPENDLHTWTGSANIGREF